MVRKLIYSAFFIFSGITICQGQTYTLKFSCPEETREVIEEFQPLQQPVRDSLEMIRKVNSLLADMYARGYLRAKVEEQRFKEDTFYMHMSAGEQYKWAHLQQGNIPEILLSKIGFRERFFLNKPFRFGEVAKLFKKVIKQGENTGYPFASVALDSVEIIDNTIQAALTYTSGPRITYDSLVIEGTTKVKTSWLAVHLDINYGEPFNQSAVNKINSRIQQLGFLELVSPVEITFKNSQATLLLSLKDVDANRIDGVIGFLPNAQNDGNLLVTGQFDLSLANLFGSGKKLAVEWQRLKPLSQFLHISYSHPNLLKSPLDFNTSYELLKEDTTFINRNAFLGFNYDVSIHTFSFFTRLKTSRLLSTEQLEDISILPEINDFNLNYYGLGYGFNTFNNPVNVRSGMGAYVEAAVGTKKIRRNVSLPSAIYDDIELNTIQYQFEGLYQYFLPLTKVFVFHQKIRGGKIINDQLFKNDLFRLGGLKSLRGFNENFFFASEYLISNIEVQLHFEENSYLFIFYDQSYLYFNIGESRLLDYPLGLGAGINFSTKAGVVSLAYAVGKSEDQPLSMRLSKFHFGYIAKF